MTDGQGRRGRGRPAVGDRVTVRLPPDLLALVDARAETAGGSRAGAIRRLLGEALGADLRPDGVDRAQIQRMLALAPRDRIRHVAEVVNATGRLRGATQRRAR